MTPGIGTEICIIGAGPRGLSVLERLCANERAAPSHAALVVHVVDPAEPGPGAVWRTGQSRHLLMNTVASQVTVFTDHSARIDGPVEPGPSLHEWARSLALLGGPADYDAAVLDEARALGPDSYPSRAFYGRYLRDCFLRIAAAAPAHVTVRTHRSRAVAMADTHGRPAGPQGVRLENGTRLDHLDGVVLAQGHLPHRLTSREARAASLSRIHGLTYVTPANPADVDLGPVEPGGNVLLRGLGLSFFDYMALLTVGRGGSFAREGARLTYRPSGREPRLFATSRRGVPYHARGENQKGTAGRHTPRLLTPDVVAALRRRAADGAPARFGTQLWPLIAREVESVYYATLLASRGAADRGAELATGYLALPPDADPGPLLRAFGVGPGEWWDWDRLSLPYDGVAFTDRDHFRSWLLGHLARDAAAAAAGNVDGPVKAALDVLRDLRNEIRLAVDHGGLEGSSYRDDLQAWYTPLNAYLSIGPPVSRIEELRALVEAGIVTLTGPGTRIVLDTGSAAFVAQSDAVPGPPVRAQVLIEARLPDPDLLRTEDPLLLHLLGTDQATPYTIPGSFGTAYETGGLAVTPRPSQLVDARGRAHPRRFAFGVPTEAVHWVTAAGIRPGVDSVIGGDADAIARALLALPPVTGTPARVDEAELAGVVV